MHEQDEPDEFCNEASPAETDGQDHALYPGDLGQLPLDTRRLLVQLLSGPSVDSRRHSQLWPVLLREQALIRSHLANLFLELVLDMDAQVAFVRQADTGEVDSPILLRRKRLTFLDSVLLLYLRQLLAEADLQGERAVVSGAEMTEQLKLYEHNISTDHAGFEKRIGSAIEKAKKNSLLSAIRGTENRFEISPTLKLLFSAEQVSYLTEIYRQAREKTGADEAVLLEEVHE